MAAGHRISVLEGFLLLILGGFAVAFLVMARAFGQTAAMFPRLIAEASLVLLAAALGFQLFGKVKAGKKRAQSEAQKAPDAVPWPFSLGVQAAYIVIIGLVGFPLATLIYLLGSPLHMRYRRWGVLAPYAVLLTVAVVASFSYLFNVRLPGGLLWTSLKGSR